MKKKLITTMIAVLTLVSIGDLSVNAMTDKYREGDLKNAGFDSVKVEEIKKVYDENELNRGISESEFDYNVFVDEIIRGMETSKKDPALKQIVPKEGQNARASLVSLLAPGDIIIEHKWGTESAFIGHTASIGTNKDYVWEINGYGQVVRSNSISRYMEDYTTPQSWNYVPDAYKNNQSAQTNAGNWPARVAGSPYLLTGGKDSIASFYCSKLSWKAWKQQGYDLDNDGGSMVLPMDIYWDNDVMPYFQQNI